MVIIGGKLFRNKSSNFMNFPPPLFPLVYPFRLILACCQLLLCGIRVIVDKNMNYENGVGHVPVKKRKRLRQLDIRKRELVKCKIL